MLTALLKNGSVQIEKTQIPKPNGNEDLVRIEYCGICGTDFQKYLNVPNVADWGHEIIGNLVNERGELTNRVTIRSTYPCGKCLECLRQLYHKCQDWKRASKNGYSEYIVVDRNCILQIDAQSDKLEYALIEPLYVAINLVKRVSPDKGDAFAIIGNGSIGLLTVFYLWLNGHKNISVFARTTCGLRRQFTDSMGIRTYDYNESINSHLFKSNKIINTAPYETMPEIIKSASPYSLITFNGISKNNRVMIEMDTWHFKSLTISPSFPHPQNDFAESMGIVDTYGEKLALLITHVFPLDEMPKVFELMRNKKVDYIKILIRSSRVDF